MSAIQGLLKHRSAWKTVGTFRIVRYIMGVCFSGVSVKRGSTVSLSYRASLLTIQLTKTFTGLVLV